MYLDGLPDWHAHDCVAPLGPFLDSSGQQEVALPWEVGSKMKSSPFRTQSSRSKIRFRACNIDKVQRNWSDATVPLEPTGEEVRVCSMSFPNGVVVDNFDVLRIPKNSCSRGPLKWMQNGIFRALHGCRRVFRSREVLLGLTSPYAMPGDSIVVSLAAPLPFVFRPANLRCVQIGWRMFP